MDKKESQQKPKKGAAPFASVEDLSDDSPEDRAKLEVPGARGGVTPRIDISRASSSSHHEDSSPERELFGGEYNFISLVDSNGLFQFAILLRKDQGSLMWLL